MIKRLLCAALALCALFSACALARAEAGETTVRLAAFVLKEYGKAKLSGQITSDSPIETVYARVYNERTLAYDVQAQAAPGEGAYTYAAEGLNAQLAKKALPAGEKSMRVSVVSGGVETEVYRAAFYVLGAPADPVSSTKLCEITVKGKSDVLRDGLLYTTNKIGKDGVKVVFPADFGAGAVELQWRKPPQSATVHYYDADFQEIAQSTLDKLYYVDLIDFDESVRGIFVETADVNGSLADVYVHKANEISSAVQRWQSPSDKLDILFVSTHQDDELLFFGGAIPYYNAIGEDIAVAYLADGGPNRYYEALSAMWVCGLKAHPIFIGYEDRKVGSVSEAQRVWARQGDPLRDLVRLIRKYKPEVVVTQDYKGEYGHFQHIYTVQLVTKAVQMAGDAANYPESADEFGAWQVKKFYSHLYAENRIYLDWSREMPDLGGVSALEIATVAYDRNASQTKYFSMEKQGPKYDNTCFGLVYSAVGEDVYKDDFLENLD